MLIASGILTIIALLTGNLWLIAISVLMFEAGTGFLGSTIEWFVSFGKGE